MKYWSDILGLKLPTLELYIAVVSHLSFLRALQLLYIANELVTPLLSCVMKFIDILYNYLTLADIFAKYHVAKV